jgi:glycosyltransferase involved in cell wall biosynthesis
MYVRLEELCSVGEVDVILFYNQEPEFALKLIRLCQHYDVLYVQQYDELHLANDYPQGILSPLYWREQLHLRCTVSRSDGNMVISTYLQGRCRQAGARSTLLVPALTNTELAVQSDSDPHGEKRDFFTFTYLGKGTRRDCLGLMLESVARVHRALPNCRLCLLGLSRASSMACHALATKLGIDDVVHIAGWLNDTDLQAALHETDAFLLLRTDDRSSRACFPTRLPEFLSLGKPVILSAVGDIPAYFTHMENALVCQPGQIDPVAANMAYLARDPDRARSIGLAGRTLCEDRFDYSKWGRDIALYFRSLTIESK